MTETVMEPQTQEPSTKTATIIYILYLVSLILPILSLVGVIMAYVYKSDSDELLYSHFRFQIRTFWIGLLYSLIGLLLLQIMVGGLILLFTVVWFIIRCAKGLKQLGERKPVANPASWMFG